MKLFSILIIIQSIILTSGLNCPTDVKVIDPNFGIGKYNCVDKNSDGCRFLPVMSLSCVLTSREKPRNNTDCYHHYCRWNHVSGYSMNITVPYPYDTIEISSEKVERLSEAEKIIVFLVYLPLLWIASRIVM